MIDTVNFWIDRAALMGSPFDILPYLSDVTQRQNEKTGYSCIGKVLDYTAGVYESGISLKGSLAKSYFGGENISTLKRRDVQCAIEQLSDCLHIDTGTAKVARLDVSTIIPTKRPTADYYRYLGDKPRFIRLEAVKDETLYYNSKQRQLVFYDKAKEATGKGTVIPEILSGNNLLRYELRYMKNIDNQLNAVVKGSILYNSVFYHAIVQNWYNEFKTIQKLKNNSYMIDGITTPKEAKDALFCLLLQKEGQSTIDEFLEELKAKNAFGDKKYYSRLKSELNSMLKATTSVEKNELVKELETAIWDIAKSAR
jgi:hypothetical protein